MITKKLTIQATTKGNEINWNISRTDINIIESLGILELIKNDLIKEVKQVDTK